MSTQFTPEDELVGTPESYTEGNDESVGKQSVMQNQSRGEGRTATLGQVSSLNPRDFHR